MTWNPITVEPIGNGRFVLVDGLLRLAVAKARGFTYLKAHYAN